MEQGVFGGKGSRHDETQLSTAHGFVTGLKRTMRNGSTLTVQRPPFDGLGNSHYKEAWTSSLTDKEEFIDVGCNMGSSMSNGRT